MTRSAGRYTRSSLELIQTDDLAALPAPKIEGAVRMITLAPEIEGGIELVRELRQTRMDCLAWSHARVS